MVHSLRMSDLMGAATPEKAQQHIRTRLGRWKQKLIDQTLRNPLLNFKPAKVTTIRIVDEKPTEVFRRIQLEARTMSFRPGTERKSQGAAEFSRHDRTQLSGRYLDNELQTELNDETLNLNLLRIYQKSTSLFEEQGFSSLCLALGMIEWRDTTDSATCLRAPIILLPVELVRETARSKFTLKATQDDPVLNPAIVEKLRASHRLSLPQLPDSFEDFEPLDYFSEIQNAIGGQKKWRVTEEINLGFFAFHKFVMYKDMEGSEDVYLQSRVIQALCGFTEHEDSGYGAVDEVVAVEHLDELLKPEETFQVLDADSSQQQAILAATTGKNVVIEGPPGTGKSQTITNLIAEMLADGKTVLFVSEKMAALDVVYNRLQTAGLTDFCLQLHSNKTSKKTVYDEFQRVLDSSRPPDHSADADLSRLSILKRYLNSYSSALHTAFGAMTMPPFKALGELALLDGAPGVTARIPQLAEIDKQAFKESCRILAEHSKLIQQIGPLTAHPWRGSELLHLKAIERDELREAARSAAKLSEDLQKSADALAEELGAARSESLGQCEVLCEIGRSLASSPGSAEGLLMNPGWNSITLEVGELLERGARYQELKAEVEERFSLDLLREPFEERLKQYENRRSQWHWPVNVKHWQDFFYFRKFLARGYKPSSTQQLIADLEQAAECRKHMLHIEEGAAMGQELFGERWQGLQSNWRKLREFAEWIVSVRAFIMQEALTARGIALAASGVNEATRIDEAIAGIRGLIDRLRSKLVEICDRAAFVSMRSNILSPSAQLSKIASWATTLADKSNRLHEWVTFNQSKKACEGTPARTVVEKFFEEAFPVEQLEPAFRRAFFSQWLDLVKSDRPALEKFGVLHHEQYINEFRALDKKVLDLARQRLRFQISKERDKQLKSKDLEEELRILQRQIRARSKLSLRKLFKEVPAVVRAIKPCFMMSPMSAAQFIDAANSPFDVVIFDEASQITTEDAVGAIVRGRQLIVVGDPKQLPPSNFFMAQILDEGQGGDEREELQLVDVDSVLEECLATTKFFSRRQLKWHYRSRHESLIAFSNKKFYNGSLLTFPGPDTGVEERGLLFDFVGGVYEGGGVNPIEARAVAQAVCEHIRTSPELSLGVGTFNIKQQTLIIDELDRLRREDPSLESFFTRKGEEEFFVKNLENIQGDDRDVIFLSVTYGRGSDGQLRHNFGPINGANGWRRLNVILTRAKLRLRVFSSMRSEDIDLTKTTSEGAKHLKDFLNYAEREVLISPEVDAKAMMESPFEQAVFEELASKGLKLIPQVGHAGYRIDFGVLDPECAGRFIAGIECDGATYHSAYTARDRDRLRQRVLEDLGWKLVRIWSTDWYHNKDSQVQRVLEFIQAARPVKGDPKPELPFTPLFAKVPESVSEEPKIPEPQDSHQPRSRAHVAGAFTSHQSLVPYIMTPMKVLGDAEAFHAALDPEIELVIAKVIQYESPIHVDELRKRVAAHWSITRLGSKIANRIDGLVQSLTNRLPVTLSDGFVVRKGQAVEARQRDLNEYAFSADSISGEEIDAFILYVLHDGSPKEKETVAAETARAIGFGRTGQKLSPRIQARIQKLLDNSKLEPCSSGIRLVQ